MAQSGQKKMTVNIQWKDQSGKPEQDIKEKYFLASLAVLFAHNLFILLMCCAFSSFQTHVSKL